MKFLVILESIAIIVGAVILWRRTKPAAPPHGRWFALLIVALAVQFGLLLLVSYLFDWARSGGTPAERLTTTTLAVAGIQLLRAALLVVAVWSWLVVVKPRLVRSWRGVVILICLIFITFVPGSTVGFGIVMLLPLARLKWTQHVHGFGRFILLILTGFLAFALAADVNIMMDADKLGESITSFGDNRSVTLIEGDLPQPAKAIIDLSRPFGHAARVMIVLLHLQIVVGFLQLLVVPIRLRGLSLKRRFTVTLAMYRFIPSTLALIFMVMIIYMGIGLHRASIVRHTFDATLEDTSGIVDAMIEQLDRAADTTVDPLRTSDDRVYVVARQLERRMPAAVHADSDAVNDAEDVDDDMQDVDAGGEEADHHEDVDDDGTDDDDDDDDDEDAQPQWTEIARSTGPDTPHAVVESNFFADMSSDSAIGLVETHGQLFLRSARIAETHGGHTGIEAFVAVDDAYVARIAQRIQTDVRVDVTPNIFIGETAVTIGNQRDAAWADTSFTVSAQFVKNVESGNPLDHRLYLARTFIPVGNWLEGLGDDNRIGAVQLKLYTSLRTLGESLTGSALAVTSQAFAVLIFVGIGLLFLIVELSAVRTGRSIIGGIVADVKVLSEAVKKFGQGDLSHRVQLEGKDEMARLATTFNTMATNIEAHQEVLLEKERLEADLALARDIQQRMLPQSAPVIPGLDVAGISIPSREVGGDLFYFLPLADGRLGLTIGDVSGKSVPAALLMSNVLAALKAEARLEEKEHEILFHLNQLIAEQVDSELFVTFFYGVVDWSNRRVRYACAGHNPPLILRASGEVEWLKEAGVPLGFMPDSTYTPAEVTFAAGDVLVLYSDGVTEAQRTTEGARDAVGDDEFFDEHRLEAAVRAAGDGTATEVIASVMDAIRAFTAGTEQSDDVTLVVVRAAG